MLPYRDTILEQTRFTAIQVVSYQVRLDTLQKQRNEFPIKGLIKLLLSRSPCCLCGRGQHRQCKMTKVASAMCFTQDPVEVTFCLRARANCLPYTHRRQCRFKVN